MKFTSGEWKILQDLFTVSDDDGCPIAITALGMRSADECIANAKLIASAHDLLQAASDAYARLLSLGQYEARHTMQGQSELAALVHAIAKATGRDAQDVQDEFEAREIMRVRA